MTETKGSTSISTRQERIAELATKFQTLTTLSHHIDEVWLREAYRRETVSFPWQKGDLLMLDNMLVAHGRAPFSGPRQILVGMAEPVTRDQARLEV